jgi:outer membrane protein
VSGRYRRSRLTVLVLMTAAGAAAAAMAQQLPPPASPALPAPPTTAGAAVTAPAPAPATPPPAAVAPPTLSLKEAEAAALANHPDLLSAQSEAAASRQLVIQTRSAYFPTVTAEVTGSLGNRDARIGAGTLTASRLFNREGQGIVVSQLLTDLGRTPNLVASSRLRAGAAEQNYQATRAGVLLGVDRAYFSVLAAQALIKVARETVGSRQVLADQVTALAQNKLRSQLDVSFAQVNVSQAKVLLIRAQDQLASAFAELARAIGSDRPASYALADEPLPPRPTDSPEPLVAGALQLRPDLLSLRLGRDAAYRTEQAEKDLQRPTVSFLGTAGSLPAIGPDAATVPNHYEGAAINVEVPLFNGHLFAARRTAAHLRAQEADQQVRALEEIISRDVRSAWGSARTAYERLDVTVELLRQANLALELAQGRYDLGLSSIVELTQAQLNLTQAEIENLSARYDYESQYAALSYATGALR